LREFVVKDDHDALRSAASAERSRKSPNTAIVNVALDAIAEHGFHLAHAAVHAELPAVTAHHGADVRMI
jgi:hypothetical protein